MRSIGKGRKYDTKRGILVFDKELEMSDNLSPTERSAKHIADFVNTINPQIKVTMDTAKRDIKGRLLVLDVKV